MSEAAAAFYQERAERLGVQLSSSFLYGEPIQLLSDPSRRISIHAPNETSMAMAAGTYEHVLRTIGVFTNTCSRTIWPDIPFGNAPYQMPANERHLWQTIPTLMPTSRRAKAGHLSDIKVETVTPQDIWPNYLAQAEDLARRLPCHPDAQVYLMTSAAVYIGSTLGRVNCLTIAMTSPLRGDKTGCKAPKVGTVLAPRYIRTRNTRNRVLVNLAFDTSSQVGSLMSPEGPAADISELQRDFTGPEAMHNYEPPTKQQTRDFIG